MLLRRTNLCSAPGCPGDARHARVQMDTESRRAFQGPAHAAPALAKANGNHNGSHNGNRDENENGGPSRVRGAHAYAYALVRGVPLKVRRAILPNTLYLMPMRNL